MTATLTYITAGIISHLSMLLICRSPIYPKSIVLPMLLSMITITTAFGPIPFDHNSTFNFNDGSMEIGCLQFSSCNNPSGSSNYHSSFTQSELFALLKYAVTVQIGPATNVPGVSETSDYTNTADLCSNPVWALNNKYELSFVLNITSSPTVCSIVCENRKQHPAYYHMSISPRPSR